MKRRFAVIVERGAVDAYGAPSGTPASHTIPGCYDWPAQSTEASTSFTQIASTRVLTCPHGADLLANDTVIYPNGGRWHVVGDPYDWDNPHTRHRPGVQANIERVR